MIQIIKEMPANAPISSERDLAVEYDASRMTVRKAINVLVDEGYLYRDANRGTFVAAKVLHKKNTTLEKADTEDEINYQIIYFDVKASSAKEIQELLHIDAEDAIVRMIRLSRIGDRPQAVEEIYIKRLNLSDEEFGNMPKWRDFNRFIAQGGLTQRFLPTLVPMKYAHMLNMRIEEPIIMVENLINSKNGQPLIYMKVFNNPKEKIIEITS